MAEIRLTIFVSFAVVDTGHERQIGAHIEKALRLNAALSSVNKIAVLSESPRDSLMNAIPLDVLDKIEITCLDHRPTFADLFAAGNHALSENECDVVCLMNADIAFGSQTDLFRMSYALMEFADKEPRGLFALTRHDEVAELPKMVLRDALGLPNLMTADAWVFCKPVHSDTELYYCPGQMFCDQFLAHDLIVSGYNILNPSLDCMMVHQEADVKDQAYYQQESDRKPNADAVMQHWRNSVAKAQGSYLGLCPVSSTAVNAGYAPRPVAIGQSRRKVYVFQQFGMPRSRGNHLDESDEVRDSMRANLESLASHSECDYFLVVEDASSHEHLLHVLGEIKPDNIYTLLVFSIHTVVKNFFAGADKHFTNFLCTQTLDILNVTGVEKFDTVLIVLGDRACATAKKRTYHVHNLSVKVTDFLASSVMSTPGIVVNWASDVRRLNNRRAWTDALVD